MGGGEQWLEHSATGVAAVELFILLLIGFVLGAKAFSHKTETATVAAIKREAPKAAQTQASDPKPADTKSPQQKKEEPKLAPRGRTSVVVLNGNGIPGAAAVNADKAHSMHYIVTATGNEVMWQGWVRMWMPSEVVSPP